MLHFLANHELLATELMALVLLRFPDAPKEFRMGVFETLKEEQAHTLMYMRRMKDCGIEFGGLALNDYFWRMVAPMEEPLDFVTRLSLTFEQANLDFSKHYAKLFRQVGDTSTANVLEKIYTDEVEHVGHGLKWFKQWKQAELSDWNAYKKQLSFPLAPWKAKGQAPFNKEGRIEAGLDEDFIHHLEVTEGSRGRTPTVHWFNPNAEGHALTSIQAQPWTPKKAEQALEKDLTMLPMTWAKKDDVVLVENKPSVSHLHYLKRAGLQQPEWVELTEDISDRKVGGLRPWAWSPDASKVLKQYESVTSAKQGMSWREPLPREWFAKKVGVELLREIQPEEKSEIAESVEQAVALVEELGGVVLMKAPFASAGRGHRKFLPEEGWIAPVLGWVRKAIEAHGYVVVEPFLDKLVDFSCQYEVLADGTVKQLGMTRVVNDPAGRFIGCFVHPKWSVGLDPEVTKWLFSEARVNEVYRYQVPKLLGEFFAGSGYVGPVGVDSMVYQNESGELKLRKIVEVNIRHTMGRVALELLRKNQGCCGFYQIARKSHLNGSLEAELEKWNAGIEAPSISEGSIVLNDPACATEFYAIWHARASYPEIAKIIPLV